MHIKLIDDAWFTAKRLWSVRFSVLGTAWASAASGWLLLPQELKPNFSEHFKMGLAIVGVLLAIAPGLSAVIHQPKLEAKLEDRKATDTVVDEPPAAMP